MSSGSPRSRIDQFYASKKRKHPSPNLKSWRSEKDAKIRGEGSPSAKGTLDNYLKASQDNNCSTESLHVASGLHVKQDAVRRNLTLEVPKFSVAETGKPFLNSQINAEISEKVEGTSKGVSQISQKDDVGAAGFLATDILVSACHTENPELKQFATGFLSLYCSEVQSIVCSPSEPKENDHKRHGSTSLVDMETRKSNKRRCTDNDLLSTTEIICPHEKKPKELEFAGKTDDFASDSAKEIIPGNGNVAVKSCLRKCDNASKSFAHVHECSTPGLSVIKTHTIGTPKSAHASSIFSPGEAFWNEAILVADDLFNQTGNINSAKINKGKVQFESDSLCRVKNDNCIEKSKELLAVGESRVRNTNFVDSSKVAEKCKMGSDKEASLLPIKNLDHLFEDKSLTANTHVHCASDDPKDFARKNSELAECGSANCKGVRTVDVATKIWTNDITPSVQDRSYPEAGANAFPLHQDKDRMIAGSPISEIRKPANSTESDEAKTPSSFLVHKDTTDLTSWLPLEVCNIYKKRGISKLYPWQVECLHIDGVLQRRNLVYCASTSAGKSFVAEILMLRRVITTGKMALLVLPYVSICAEKAEHLEVLLEPLGKHVRSYYGNQGGGTLPKDTSVAVCTIEKANFLINRLLEEGRLSELGVIVIDELHMVGDQHRGYLLELMLTKLRYAAGEGFSESSSGESSGNSSSKADSAHGLQIVGMSATMPNVGAVADWLQAALYQTDFRPVPLEEFIKVGNTIYNKKMEVVRTISKAADLGGKDPDHIAELCNEIVQEGHSVLIFCSSRKGCESTARHVSKFIGKFSVNVSGENSEFVDISSAIDALRRSPAGVDPTLEETLPSGVAYHHAGLTVEEREIVETCYRKGLVRVLTATSTLAAGVNLPARRVIFRQPMIGRDFIDGTRYKQMAGRAGRTGIDTKGESVLICKTGEVKRIMGLLNESCPPLHSCLSEDKNGMTHAILEVVAGGIVQTAKDIHRYVRCTLLNSTKPFQDVVKSAQDSLRWLCHRKFLEWNEDTKLYSTTPLGRASFGSSLCPEESLIVLDDLLRAREGFVLASDLHLVYLVTPINVDVEPNWELYYERFMELSALDQSVGNRVGVTEPFLMRMAHGAPMRTSNRSKDRIKDLRGGSSGRRFSTSNNTLSDEQTLRVCKRFYVALILSRLVQEAPVSKVCETFKVARGMVQALQENAGRFASMVSVFCERLGWHDLEGLVAKFQNRVSFGVRAEIAELTSVPYVKGSRARALYKAGLRTPISIAEASIPEIVKALFESSAWTAQESTAQRRIQLGVAKKIKNGARRIVLDKAEEARLAAFSAFKSLGLTVPQLSQPLPAYAVRSSDRQETAGDDISSGSVASRETELYRGKLCIEGTITGGGIASGSGGEKLKEIPGVGLGVSSEVNLSSHLPNSQAEGTVVGSDKINVVTHSFNDTDMSLSVQVGKAGNGDIAHERYIKQGPNRDSNLFTSEKNTAWEKGPISAVSVPGGFDSFLNLWDSAREFYFDIHYNKRSEVNSHVPFEIHGMAICWENSPIYYVNLLKDLLYSKNRKQELPFDDASSVNKNALGPHHLLKIIKVRWNRIREIMRRKDVRKFTWNLKIQMQVLKTPAMSIRRYASLNLGERSEDLDIIDGSFLLLTPVCIRHSIDMCIVTWLLWPDEERSSNPNLEKEVKKRLSPEAAAAATRSGRWRNQMRRVAHNGCCRRVSQTRALCFALWKILASEELVEVLTNIEMPLVNVLADMELWGIGVDIEGCLHARGVLAKKLRSLEKEAYELAGMTFSLNNPADIASVLYGHLKLPMPEGQSKGKLHPSTDKHCLDMLRNEHPIVPVIKEYRTLAKLLNCTLGSICSLARLCLETQRYTLHGHWLQTSTGTGRVSIEEPNLQCVEHEVEFTLTKDKKGVDSDADWHRINARDFLVPTQENWLLLAADYSQIELRVMAHFARDSSLIELLSKPEGDVFTMIAARWTRRPEDAVGSHERDQTKRLVYGILYGMGANRLAEQLNCSSDEAKEKIKSFKSFFPGVGSWLKETISCCRQKGYIETLKGRKRFLSKIKFGNAEEKSKAQRQAVNSICQGSAADIIKIAMINIYSIISGEVDMQESSSLASEFNMLKGHCRILLQVHDELVLEINPCFAKEAALLLQTSMERAVSLLVPLHVKLKVGKTWGSLEPFQADKDVNEC